MTAQVTTTRIRPALATDITAIVDVVQAAYRGEGGWTTEAHLVRGMRTHENEIRSMLADDTVALLVVEDTEITSTPEASAASEDPEPLAGSADTAGTVIGCCYSRREPFEGTGRSRAELGLFAVHPSAQARGIGGRLLEAQVILLRTAGVDVLEIQVLQSRSELHAWYERHGFLRTGTAAPFPGDPAWLTVEGLGMDLMERPLQAL